MKHKEIEIALSNLRSTINVIDNFCSREENYNTAYAQHLETLSWHLWKNANELQQIKEELGV